MTAGVQHVLPDDLAVLVDELRSPDPRVRDDKACSAVAGLVGAGRSDDHLRALGDAGAELLGVRAERDGAVLAMPERDELLGHLGAALADVGWCYGRPT